MNYYLNCDYKYYVNEQKFTPSSDEQDFLKKATNETNVKVHLIATDYKDIKLVEDTLNKLKTNPKTKFFLTLKLDKDYIDNEEEIKEIQKFYEKIINLDCSFNLELNDAEGKLEDFLIAKKKVDNFINKLNDFKVSENGKTRNLSVMEKFFVIYNYASNKVYNKAEESYHNINIEMRNWMGVLSGDYVICSGFASTLKLLCNRAFSKEELMCLTQSASIYNKEGRHLGDHANNIIYINDPLYNLKGFAYADSCWDSKKEENGDPTFRYTLLNLDEIFEEPNYSFGFNEILFYDSLKNNKKNHLTNEYNDKVISNLFNELTEKETIFEHTMKYKKIEAILETKQQSKLGQLDLFVQKNNLSQILDTPSLSRYRNVIREQFPIIDEFHNHLKLIKDINQLSVDKITAYANFLNKNSELLKQEISFAKSYNLDISSNLKNEIYNQIKQQIKQERNNQQYILNYSKRQKFQQETLDERSLRLKDHIQNNILERLPENVIKSGIKATALFNGMTDENQINEYVQKHFNKRKALFPGKQQEIEQGM